MSLYVDIEKRLGAFHLRAQFEAPDETMALLGASGCGKSMTLKCIAGIVTPDRGRIVLGDRVLFDSEKHIDLTPQQRRVGYLFQQYALFPTMTVEQNILCGIRSGDRAEKRRVLAGYRNFLPARRCDGGMELTSWNIVLPLTAARETLTVAIPDEAVCLPEGPYTAVVQWVVRDLHVTVVLLRPVGGGEEVLLRAVLPEGTTAAAGETVRFGLLAEKCLCCG